MTKSKHTRPTAPADALTVGALALRQELKSGSMAPLGGLEAGGLTAEILLGVDSVWALIRRPGKGALALRCAHSPGGQLTASSKKKGPFCVTSPVGAFEIDVRFEVAEKTVFRCTTTLTPADDLLIPFMPRDLYPLSEDGDPGAATGRVEAAQRGLNSGLVFLTMQEPAFGAALYFQNFTALNPYFKAVGAKPDGVVGGEWPELGYLPPAAPIGNSPPVNPLPAGKPTVIADTLIAFDPTCSADECPLAATFLDLLASIYRLIDKPIAEHHDWPARARKTAHDLATSPKATVSQYGYKYVHPYTASEYPDSMVQLTVLAALNGYGRWLGEPHPIEAELRKGLGRFFDRKLGVVRRYLPNVGKDKDADAVDSWYLYHPLINLARLAWHGDAKAKRLLADSLDYGIKAARHFNYEWPIQYKVDTFEVITKDRGESGLGQTDVGGLYAYLMMQAHEMFGDNRYLEEAKRALAALKDMRFELAYQANITAWGAVGCLKVWRATGEEKYRAQAFVFLASLLHNSPMWESEIELATHYRNFFGVTCLHDGPYMAMYEEFEVAAAFEEFFAVGGDDLPDSVRMLLAEYRRFALDRTWYYYPDALPPKAVAKDNIRNGHIDRALSFPLEDLYMDGQPAGQVGQEIYGCGAAFIFAMRAFHRIEGAPFELFCDYPLRRVTQGRGGSATVLLEGSPKVACALRVIPGRRKLDHVRAFIGGKVLKALHVHGRIEFAVPGGSEVELDWVRNSASATVTKPSG